MTNVSDLTCGTSEELENRLKKRNELSVEPAETKGGERLWGT